MNPEVLSIRTSFYQLFPVKLYDEEVPEELIVPSMYFPPAFSFDGPGTLSTFEKTYSLSVKLFHKSTLQAHAEAERIADAIRSRRLLVPILSPKGVLTGEYVRLNRIETRQGSNGMALIVLTWDSRYYYEQEEFKPFTRVEVESGVK
ncbi:phage portal protein [Domibacillus tundrae]|uniref:phage portal protein n=1 Tax=Domibacillus tundrae TaxID=1587527 RepID=UPI000617CD5B|nr:phage portal protein [Domibacillus tundrae]